MAADIPSAGGIGEIRSKRIPGREDVPEEVKVESVEAVQPSLSLDDIELMIALLDTCAERGSFKLDEFGIIHRLHGKLLSIIQSADTTQ